MAQCATSSKAGTEPGSAIGPGDEHRLFATLLAHLDGFVYRCRADEQRTIEYVRGACEELTGYRPAEFASGQRGWERLVHPDDRLHRRRALDSALVHRTRYELEYRIVRADRTLRWAWERGAGAYAPDGSVIALEGVVQDITARRAIQESLGEAERRFRSIFENAIEGIFRSTPRDGYVVVNPALARMYGYETPEQLIGELRDIGRQLYVDPGRRDQFMEAIERHGTVSGFESQVYRRDGSIIWISENARALRDVSGVVEAYEGTVEAITERKRHEALIRHQATHDALTGLPNRLLLHEALAAALAQLREGSLVALAFVDLDQFKLVNDTLGHHAGDRLLQRMAQRLAAAVGPHDMVARQGGDEFVILLRGAGGCDELQDAAARIIDAVAQPLELDGRELSLTCSVGLSVAPLHGRDIESLLRSADTAMYRAKDDGRNTVRFFDEAMSAAASSRLALLGSLHHALERDELRLVFEPKCEIASRRIVGVEALLRWHLGERVVPPGEFIPLAEDTGLIVAIGEWVLRSACRQNVAWRKQGLAAIPISVNIAPRQLAQPDIVERIDAILRETGLPADGLELEVTEGALLRDTERAIERLRRLRDLGVRLSIDDFGTGYSSLAYLRRLPVECIKVDRSFIRDVSADADSAAIVRAVVSLGRELGLRTLAEGVETDAQLEFLCGLGCDEIQGFLLSRPQGAAEFALRLRAMRA